MSVQTVSLRDQQRRIVAKLQDEYLNGKFTLEEQDDLSRRLSVAISDLCNLTMNGE